jgi:hypothetical protein
MKLLLIGVPLTVCGVLSAQTPAQERKENANRIAAGLRPSTVTVIERTAKAILVTGIAAEPPDRFPRYHAHAECPGVRPGVEGKQGYIEIEVEFRNLSEANHPASSISHTFCGPSLRKAVRPIWEKFSAMVPAASWM